QPGGRLRPRRRRRGGAVRGPGRAGGARVLLRRRHAGAAGGRHGEADRGGVCRRPGTGGGGGGPPGGGPGGGRPPGGPPTARAPLLHLHVGDGVLRTTQGHPFYAHGRGWVLAGRLAVGDALRTADGGWAAVTDLCDGGATEPVYNLQVEGHHTYFVVLPD